jgi:hypothetical protein
MGSPLFRNSENLFRKAQSKFSRSAAGTILREVEAVAKGRSYTPAKLSRALKDVQKYHGDPKKLVSQAVDSELGQIVGEMAKYAKDPLQSQAIESFLGALGPVGKALAAIIGPAAKGTLGSTPSMTAAVSMVRAMGSEILPALEVKSGPEFDRALEAVKVWAATHGYSLERAGVPGVSLPTGKQPAPPLSPRSKRQPQGRKPYVRKTVDVPLARGGTKRYPKDHPIVTGQFVMTPASTNVHSFGYDMDAAILYVRYLHSDESGNPTGPGALYRYSPIEPELFESLYKVRRGGGGQGGASTPGTWIWTNLRVRGTVSGHTKDYALVGVMNMYVPRKATVHPDFGEVFVQRRVRTLDGQWITSERPHGEIANSRLTSTIQAGNVNRGRASTGRPNEPNRGRPRTGRL